MQAPSAAANTEPASYATLPDDPQDALVWLATLPDQAPFRCYAPICEKRCLDPAAPRWWIVRGYLHWRLGEPEQALTCYERAAEHASRDPSFHLLCGMAARKLPDRLLFAEQSYEHAISLEPTRADAHYNLANLYREDRPQQAECAYVTSLGLDSKQPMAWHNYGLLLLQESRLNEAESALRTSLKLDPSEAAVWCNLGLTFFGQQRLLEADRALCRAIALDPAALGGDPQLALSRWHAEQSLAPSTIDAVWDLALLALAQGDYRHGWSLYEIRTSTKAFIPSEVPTGGPRLRRLADAPRSGESALVVWSEQGMGDAIQFGRYLALLDGAGIPYEFRCRAPLHSLFRDWFGLADRAIVEAGHTDTADLRPHVSLLSLPHLFRTELDSIPSFTPYCAAPAPPPHHLRVPTPPGGLSVGLVWAANPANKAMYKNKSISLELLMPRFEQLLNLDLIELHCLQFGSDNRQLDPWRHLDCITDWTPSISDFSDTAHILSQLDLIITVDTAIAHLAGALNRPTWVLLPYNCDFRWQLVGDSSPWYPQNMRLFRQATLGNWQSVISQLITATDDLFMFDIDALHRSLFARSTLEHPALGHHLTPADPSATANR